LADDLFLIMLDDASGRLRVQPRIAGYGLAGGLLVELWLAGHVAVDPERVRVVSGTPVRDSLLAWALTGVTSQRVPGEVACWLEFLAATSIDGIVDRLVGSGWIRRQGRRGLFGRREVFAAVNRNAVFWRAGRLSNDLSRTPSWEDLFLTGLLDAMGTVNQILGDQRGPGVDRIVRTIGQRLSRDAAPVAVVCRHVQTLSARAAISLR
jgi:hypothetical protein